MKNILKVTKYQLRDFRNSVIIYYAVILALGVTMTVSIINNQSTGESNITGGSFVFLFILGLNCFKANYKFLQANNITRKMFYLGNILAITSTGAIMAALDTGLGRFSVMGSIFEQVYVDQQNIFGEFMWSFALLIFVACLGWLITMIYYRSNSIVKILVSISPVFFIMIFVYISRVTNGSFAIKIFDFFMRTMGLTNGQNYLIGMFTFLVAAAIVCLPIFMLTIKAPIKD